MKSYMMIFLGADYGHLGLSPEQIQEKMGKWFAWDGDMKARGIHVSGDALTPVGKRLTGPDQLMTDSPAAASKEIIGGYYVIQVENFEKALEEAKNYPDFDLGGTVEIREVLVFE